MVGKNFYLLARLEADPALRRQLAADEVLQRIARSKVEALAAGGDCCAAAKFSASEVDAVATRMRELGGPLRAFVSGALRDSGVAVRYHAMTDAELVEAVWRDEAKGLNRVIETYGEGKAPFYPAIDSISHDAKSESYKRVLNGLMAAVGGSGLFFAPSLRFATALLAVNRRDEAGSSSSWPGDSISYCSAKLMTRSEATRRRKWWGRSSPGWFSPAAATSSASAWIVLA